MYRPDQSALIDCVTPVNRQHPLANGLAAWWLCIPGMMGGAKWRDLMSPADLAVGNHGTLTGITQGTTSGWQGTNRLGGFGHVLFDSSNDYVSSTPPLGGLSQATMAFWLKWNTYANDDKLAFEYTPNYNGANGIIVDPNSSSSGLFDLGISTGMSYSVTKIARPSAGVWHHFLFTMDRTLASNQTATVFVDGISQAPLSYAFNNMSSGSTFSTDTLYMMCRGGASLFGGGALDGVMFWNRLLTLAESPLVYNLGLQGYPGLLRRVTSREWGFGASNAPAPYYPSWSE